MMSDKQREVLDRFHCATDKWIEALQELSRYHNVDPTNAVNEVDQLRMKISRAIWLASWG
jgi:hypothetical protein